MGWDRGHGAKSATENYEQNNNFVFLSSKREGKTSRRKTQKKLSTHLCRVRRRRLRHFCFPDEQVTRLLIVYA